MAFCSVLVTGTLSNGGLAVCPGWNGGAAGEQGGECEKPGEWRVEGSPQDHRILVEILNSVAGYWVFMSCESPLSGRDATPHMRAPVRARTWTWVQPSAEVMQGVVPGPWGGLSAGRGWPLLLTQGHFQAWPQGQAAH